MSCLFSLLTFANIALSIVYPSDGARLPFLKHEFIFGSATPGSVVRVNGMRAYSVASGGWIAFVPVAPGAFHLRVAAGENGETAFAERVIHVASPPHTTPATPARIDLSVAPRPAQNAILRQRELVTAFVKASVGARVYASFGSGTPSARLSPVSVSRLSQSESKSVLGGAFAGEVAVDGLYQGKLQIPAAAHGALRVRYTVTAPDGSTARALSKGSIDVMPSGWSRAGSIVPGDHTKDIDARPFGVVESEPHGDWLFSSPADTRFEVTGIADDYYRVALSSDQNGWIAKRSLALLPPDTPQPRISVRDVELRDEARSGIITIRLTGRAPFWIEEPATGPALRVHIYDVSASADFSRPGDAAGNIAGIRWNRERDGTAAVDVTLRQRTLWGYSATWDGDDLEIAVKRPPLLAAPPAPALKGLVIVIDPGHSPDPGSIGPLGTIERDVNLDIAKHLANRLEELGARAVLTRTSDVPVGLYDRPTFAVQQNADILISVHNNALPDSTDPFTHHGFSVYYFRRQSLALATAIHDAYRRDLGIPDEGLYQDELALTRATEEPAVLTESAFVMWPPEEMYLRDAAFRDRCAKAIADGLNSWVAAQR